METLSKDSSFVRRTNSHHSESSIEHFNVLRQYQLNRTQSNASHLTQQQNTHRYRRRITSEKPCSAANRTPTMTNHRPLFQRHSSRLTQDGNTPRRHRSRNSS